MLKKERYKAFVEHFSKNMPVAETELKFESTFQLLIAVVLSAQCTDKRINMVTPALFRDFPSPEHLAASNFDELFPYIKTVSYPNNKTKHLLGLGKMLVEDFNSEVPDTVNELIKLPGVGRKTANNYQCSMEPTQYGSRYACFQGFEKTWFGRSKSKNPLRSRKRFS